MKLTKAKLKELIRTSIREVSEDERKTVVTKKEKEGPKKANTDIKDNPFDDNGEVEEGKINELEFGSKAQYDAYKKKHNIKPGTKIKVAGKKSTHKGTGKISKVAAKKS